MPNLTIDPAGGKRHPIRCDQVLTGQMLATGAFSDMMTGGHQRHQICV